MADKYTFKDVHRLYYWCNKVLPTVYDDSLSYYELLNKIALKLNTLIENYNELPEYIVQEIAEMLQSEELGAILQGVISNFMLNVKYPPAGITPAVGDGAADDTEAIQGCIDWASENGGGAVYIPAGWYLTQSITLRENVSLIGYDRYATVFTLKGGATEPLVTALGSNTIAGITLNANTAVQTEYQNALTVSGEDHLIKDVILDGGNYGLESTSTGHLQINNVIVPGCVVAGLYLHGSAQVQAENVMVENVSEIAGDASYIINGNNGTFQIGTIARVDEGVVLNGNKNYVQLRVENAATKVTDNGTGNQYLIETEGDNVTNTLLDGLREDVDAETADRISEITRVEGLITSEETAREAADTAINTAISTEIENRTSADTALTNSINAETTARENADTALSDRIDTAEQFMDDFLVQHYVLGGDDRLWWHIHNQAEFDKFLQIFRHGGTTRGCYIESSGNYKFTGGEGTNGIYPIFNGVQMHIYVDAAGVTLDVNCATLYTGHIAIMGRNGARVKIIDTNTYPDAVSRAWYPEGGTTFFTNCDFYTTLTVWSGAVHFDNCAWYDYKASRNVAIDILGGAVCDIRNGFGYYRNGFYDSSDAVFGIGPNSKVAITGRFTLKRPSTNSGYLIRYRNGGQFTLQLDGSFYDPDNERSYGSGNVGSLLGALWQPNLAIFDIRASSQVNVDQFYYTGAAQTWARTNVQLRGAYPAGS